MHSGPEHATVIAWECTSVPIRNLARDAYLDFKVSIFLSRYSLVEFAVLSKDSFAAWLSCFLLGLAMCFRQWGVSCISIVQ
jgi:hypothetical protein